MFDAEQYTENLELAAEFIKSRDSRKAEVGLIMGSGLGKLGDSIQNSTVIPYSEIPGFPRSTAVGHKGNLIIGELGGKTVFAMQGRFHFYEGYSMLQVTMPERIMSLLGIRYLFVSNAAGGLNTDYQLGDIMIIKDHINLAPNPLIGPNLDRFGTRFPDMSRPYSPSLIRLGERCAAELDIPVQKGVYVIVTGPSYETPAECHFLRMIGADAVGMSTVPEVVVAQHCGMEIFGVSIITDAASEVRKDNEKIDGDDVVRIADQTADKMTSLFIRMMERL